MRELLPSLKQFFELATTAPVAAVAILGLLLLGYVAYAAGAAYKQCNGAAFGEFVRLHMVIVIAGLVIVITSY